MKNNSIPFLSNRMLFRTVISLLFILVSCSDDSDGSDDDSGNADDTVDFSLITGLYDGTSTAPQGTTIVSARILPTGTPNEFRFEYYGSFGQMACCNTNLSRPDAAGNFILEADNDIDLNLNWSTDDPDCSGTFSGNDGVFSDGQITIRLTAEVDCTPVDSFDLLFFKTEDIQ
ncbi:MAG: hypothetical protein AAGF96_11895 [Bacteroidota bacterium]